MTVVKMPGALIFSVLFHIGAVSAVLLFSPGNIIIESDAFEVVAFSSVKSAAKITSKSVNQFQKPQPESSSGNKVAVSENVKNSKTVHMTDSMPQSESGASGETSLVPADSGLVTQGLRPLNLDEIKKIIKRTPEALEKNIVGSVKLKLLVDDQGQVRRVTAMNSLGYGLDQVAEAAAWKLLFSPAKIGSKPVALETYYTVRFNLEHN